MSQPGNSYADRKATARCVSSGCSSPLAADSLLCERHRRRENKRMRRRAKEKRAAQRLSGLCAFCSTPSKTYRCPPCTLRAAKLPSVPTGVTKAERNRARIKTGDDGRTRFHGQQRRGNQPHVQLNKQDVTSAIRALRQSFLGLEYTETTEAKLTPKIQRDDFESAINYQLKHASDFIDEVLARRGFFRQPR